VAIQAQYWVHDPGRPAAEHVTRLTDATEIEHFVTVLAGNRVSDAILTHERRPLVPTAIPGVRVPDHSLIMGVRGDRATLSYRGHDGHSTSPVHLFSHGDGDLAPDLFDDFPPDREIPRAALLPALLEFLHTANRPTCVKWQPGRVAVPH